MLIKYSFKALQLCTCMKSVNNLVWVPLKLQILTHTALSNNKELLVVINK